LADVGPGLPETANSPNVGQVWVVVIRFYRYRVTFNLIFRSFQMNQRALIAAAAASLMSLTFVATPVLAQDKEKCFGIAKVGQNDCANLTGTHSCAGQSKVSDDKGEWKYVAKGTCVSMSGLTADQAKKASMMKDGEMKKDMEKKS
jgi:uncharacterized membrane protein